MPSKKEVIQGLRTLLAEHGKEKTPQEAEARLANAEALYDTVNADVYEHFASMTPGKIMVAAMREKCDLNEMFTVRNMIMFIYERGYLGIKDAPWEHPLQEPKSNLGDVVEVLGDAENIPDPPPLD